MSESAKIIEARIAGVEQNCNGRHERTNEALGKAKDLAVQNREQLILIDGRKGGEGKVQDLRDDVAELQSWRRKVDQALVRSALGAMGGGGLVAAIIEAVKRLT